MTDDIDLLRQAAECAPKVLPKVIGSYVRREIAAAERTVYKGLAHLYPEIVDEALALARAVLDLPVPAPAVDDYGPGDHVMVTVDPARNFGAPSLSRRMVPLSAVLGLLLAGEPLATVRDEHDLTEAEGRLVEALAEVARDLSSPESNPPEAPRG